MSLLGVDLGSSQCKVVAVSASGEILAVSTRRYTPVSPGHAMLELDPNIFWQATSEAIREVAGQIAEPVVALAVGSHGETIIPVDGHGDAVGPAILNADNRAIDEAGWFERQMGREHIYRITGAVAHPMYAVPKICWLRKHNPDMYAAASGFVSAADYILIRMGLSRYTDYSLASRMMAFDVHSRGWSEEILDMAELSKEQFSEPVQAGTIAGKLSRTAAAELGLDAGTIVALAGHDQPCGALGTGAIGPGMVADSAGTYECLAVTSDEPRLSDLSLASSLNSYCHVVSGKYITLSFFPAGIMTRWFMDKLASHEAQSALESGEDIYACFDRKSPENPSGLIITPHLIGSCNPYWNPNARGVITGLTLQTDLYSIYKGIQEGICSEFAVNAKVLSQVSGEFDTVRITGGGARSSFGLRLRASLSGLSMLTLRNPEAVCLGGAMLAGIASGIFSDPDDAIHHLVHIADTVLPDSSLMARYSNQLENYDKVYAALAPTNEI